jgi:hypothetical protein
MLLVILMLVGVVASLLAVGVVMVFAFFLRAVATSLSRPGQAFNCLLLAMGAGLLTVLGLPGGGVSVYVSMAGPMSIGLGSAPSLVWLVPICGLGSGGLLLVVAVWLVVTVFAVRTGLTEHLAIRDESADR